VVVVELSELVLGLQTSDVVLMGNKAAGTVAAVPEVEKKDDPRSAMVDYWQL
jgi:hypothetical protein